MQQQQRGTRTISPQMDEMQIFAKYLGGELGEGAEAAFLRMPVVPRAPIVGEPFGIRTAYA